MYSLALCASKGVSRGVFADGVSLHAVRIKRLKNSSGVRMVEAFREVTTARNLLLAERP